MDSLQLLIEQGLAEGLYLGASYRVCQLEAGTLASGVVGRAQEGPDVAVTAGTVWDLASITKPVATATSILMLAQEGRFHLDEPVSAFLPSPAPGLSGVTLRHCLTHTSGLRPWTQLHSRELSRSEIVAEVCAAEPQRPPGMGYAYSDLGYILLGEVVQSVSGQNVAAFARERIFEPLGMGRTCYLPPREWRSHTAATRCPDRARVLVGEVHDGNSAAMEGISGHAGLFGTVADLVTYGRMLLNEGELNGARILCPLAARQMMCNQNPPGISGHTLGWFTRPNGYLPAGDFLPEGTFGHTGFTGTSLLLSPTLGLVAILLTNRVYQQREAGDFIRFRRRFHNAIAGILAG